MRVSFCWLIPNLAHISHCATTCRLDLLSYLARKGILWLVVDTILPPCVMNEFLFDVRVKLCWGNHLFTSEYQFILYGQFISCTKVCVHGLAQVPVVYYQANRRECFFFHESQRLVSCSCWFDCRHFVGDIGRNLAMLI